MEDTFVGPRGEQIELFCNATGFPSNFSYEWRFNGRIMSTNQKIDIDILKTLQGGYYSCKSTNEIGISGSMKFKMTVRNSK